ncbi:MAG: glycosyltransferase family 2 protein [Pseudomonadales bacterium]
MGDFDTVKAQGNIEEPYVVAVVLTWNDAELTTKCLASLHESDYANMDIVLVDNGSMPARGPELLERFPSIRLVQLQENQGFSGGANRGFETALEMGADYVHLIGNDATIAPHTTSALVVECEARPDVGAASPLLLDPGEPKIVQFYTATLDRDTARHFHHYMGEPYEPGRWPVTESEFIPMVALFFRSKALRQVGLLDESFGTCWEDFDLCLRFHDAGWKYITVGEATATHISGYTTGRVSPYITYYTTRNRLICLERYAAPGTWRREWMLLLRTFWVQMKGYGLTNWACHKAFFRGFFDYLVNVHGERRLTGPGNIPGQS